MSKKPRPRPLTISALDLQSLSFFERGVWTGLLLLMNESECRGRLVKNGAAMPMSEVCDALGNDMAVPLLNEVLGTLIAAGLAARDDDGIIYSQRLINDSRLREKRSKAGRQGGNPVLLKQKPQKRESQRVIKAMSSSVTEDGTIADTGCKRPSINEIHALVKQKSEPVASQEVVENESPPILPLVANGQRNTHILSYLTLNKKENKRPPMPPNTDIDNLQTFDAARRIYPGRKRGLETEFKNFKQKHDDWRAVLPLLQPSIEAERNRRKNAPPNEWMPTWKNFVTWINTRSWEEVIESTDTGSGLEPGEYYASDRRTS